MSQMEAQMRSDDETVVVFVVNLPNSSVKIGQEQSLLSLDDRMEDGTVGRVESRESKTLGRR